MNKKNFKIIVSVFLVLSLSVIACSTSFGSLLPLQEGGSEVSQTVQNEIPSAKQQVPASSSTGNSQSSYSLPQIQNNLPFQAGDEVLTKLYKTVNPGVVAIWVIMPAGISQGSGFVVDKEGHILTNYHVIQDAIDVEVNFTGSYKTYGKVIAKDLDSDLGVIKVNVPADILFPLPLGDSNLIEVGQTVVAIGNPFGFSGTMTVGIISGKGRTLESLRATPEGDYFTSSDLLQTDAAINPGNSGGPLINLRGEVVGVNRAIQTTNVSISGAPLNSGVGFAVSSNLIKRVLPYLIAEGKYDYPYLGLEGLPELTLEAQKQLNLPQANGVFVTRVANGGPAQKAGIRRGDLIVAVDNQIVNSFSDMISYLILNKSPKDQIVVSVLRGNNRQDFKVILEKRP